MKVFVKAAAFKSFPLLVCPCLLCRFLVDTEGNDIALKEPIQDPIALQALKPPLLLPSLHHQVGCQLA